MMNRLNCVVFVFGLLLASGCSSLHTPTPQIRELRIMTHDSFAISESIIHMFEEENGIKVVFMKSGDTGTLLNRAILTSASPEADLLYGIDNTYLSRALSADLFEPYHSEILSSVPVEFILDQNKFVTPIDYGDVCINYDRLYFSKHNLAVPHDLAELIQEEYRGLLVVENPATSSPGLAFLLTTIQRFGEDGYLDFWNSLKTNGVVVVNDWSTAYYTNFSGSSGRGLQPMVVSYNTSPAAEVYFAETPIDDPPTASITAPSTCFRQIEFAGILKGTPNRSLAALFIDHMLGIPFQEDIPLQMFVFPVLPNATLPPVFQNTISLVGQPAMLSPELIAEMRDGWIQAWMEVMRK
ncbi:MAG: thiamine ABC transporter substrate-binding protein [Anaerolineaceae bacterium]|nr:thiamine ABC transporter substrate-binding protein [Anaerolineaceae bacterium]